MIIFNNTSADFVLMSVEDDHNAPLSTQLGFGDLVLEYVNQIEKNLPKIRHF